jgi:hypothetical protein
MGRFCYGVLEHWIKKESCDAAMRPEDREPAIIARFVDAAAEAAL